MERVDKLEVFHGTAAEGLRWIVRSSADTATRPGTMLHIYRGDEHLSGSGFGGQHLAQGEILHEWRGRTDDQPWFVMACAAPEVTRVVATTDRGADVELSLSNVIGIFGVRFAVADLPRGHGPGSLRAEINGTTAETRLQPTAPAPPHTQGAGWLHTAS